MFKIAEVVKRHLQVKCTRLLTLIGGLPLLFIYMGDGTPKNQYEQWSLYKQCLRRDGCKEDAKQWERRRRVLRAGGIP